MTQMTFKWVAVGCEKGQVVYSLHIGHIGPDLPTEWQTCSVSGMLEFEKLQ